MSAREPFRVRLARLICPPSHRLIEVEDYVSDPRQAASDLIRAVEGIANNGWGCDPAILYNAAAILIRQSKARSLTCGERVTPETYDRAIVFAYTNWRGELEDRTVTPISIRWGATEWHPEPGWLLRGYDHTKEAEREFALKDCGFAKRTLAEN